MYFYTAMSDISRFLPSSEMQSIANIGSNRLAAAQTQVQETLSKQSLARSIEAGLGGMKMTTFGGKVFSAVEKEGGAYLKQQVGRLESTAKDAAGNAWESAKAALKGRDPVQMDEIGQVEDEVTAPAAAVEAGVADTSIAGRAGALSSRLSDLQAKLQGAKDEPPPRPTEAKPEIEDEPPELPDPADKPSVAELAKPETAAEGEEGGVATLASEEGGLITGSETLGAILDATGIGAPLGLLLGAVGVGLALKKDKPATIPVSSADTGGFSYQIGI